jgi:hypothetical protein
MMLRDLPFELLIVILSVVALMIAKALLSPTRRPGDRR